MNYRTLFRIVVVVHLALTIAGGWLGRSTRNALPGPLRDYAFAEPPLTTWLLAVGGLMILLTIITAVGLFAFWRPARPLYLASMALAFTAAPFAPPTVQTSLASALLSLAAMFAGLMVGLMYFTPAANEFRRAET